MLKHVPDIDCIWDRGAKLVNRIMTSTQQCLSTAQDLAEGGNEKQNLNLSGSGVRCHPNSFSLAVYCIEPLVRP